MTLEEAKKSIGKLVMTEHPLHKLCRAIPWHGPYKSLKVTKGGVCVLEQLEEFRIPPTQISLH